MLQLFGLSHKIGKRLHISGSSMAVHRIVQQLNLQCVWLPGKRLSPFHPTETRNGPDIPAAEAGGFTGRFDKGLAPTLEASMARRISIRQTSRANNRRQAFVLIFFGV